MGLLWTCFYIQVRPHRGNLQEADKKGRGYERNLRQIHPQVTNEEVGKDMSVGKDLLDRLLLDLQNIS